MTIRSEPIKIDADAKCVLFGFEDLEENLMKYISQVHAKYVPLGSYS